VTTHICMMGYCNKQALAFFIVHGVGLQAYCLQCKPTFSTYGVEELTQEEYRIQLAQEVMES